MSSHESFYTQLSSPAGPPPPPPPKPYSQDVSRTGTPTTNQNLAPAPPPPHPSHAQYQQQPPLPPHPSQIQRPQIPTPYSPPPPGQSTPQPPYQTHPTHTQAYPQSPAPPPHPAFQRHQPHQPQLPTTFDLPDSIKSHTTTDLSTLLGNPDLLTSLAIQHPAYAVSLQPLQSQIASNLALAQQVSSSEAQVKALREQTGQLMLQHTSLQTQWSRKQGEMDEALAPWGPRAMYQRLVAGIGEQEALLRAVYESFLEGGSEGHAYYDDADGKATEKEVTDWVKRIREGTVVLEKRREMRARWDEGRVGGWR